MNKRFFSDVRTYIGLFIFGLLLGADYYFSRLISLYSYSDQGNVAFNVATFLLMFALPIIAFATLCCVWFLYAISWMIGNRILIKIKKRNYKSL